jgi:hypothetical protein
MRTELIEHLARNGIDGGMLTLLSNVGGAIAAVDRVPIDTEPATRAVVSDGEVIRLTLYGEDGAVAACYLPPARALALVARLLEAASARLR